MDTDTEAINQNMCNPQFLMGQTIRLNKTALRNLAQIPLSPGKKQVEITDSICKGLKAVISKTGKISYHSRFHHKHRRHSTYLGDDSQMTVDSARKDATAFRLAVQKGDVFVPEKDQKITIESALSQYAIHSKATKKSFKADLSKISCHLVPFFGKKMTLKNLTEEDINRYLEHLVKKGLSEATCDRHIALLKAAAKYFVAQGWIPSSFMTKIKMSCPKNGKKDYLSVRELGCFILSCQELPGDPFRAFEFIASSGVRISEALSARLEHWDRDSNTLYLPDSKTGERHLTLNPSSTAILDIQTQKYGDTGLVFRGRSKDRPMARPVRAWQTVRERSGLNNRTVTPHTLRHTYCSHLLMNGVDLFTVSKLMGLSSTHCIQRHYGHLSDQTLAKASAVATEVINQSIKKVTQK